MFLEASEIDEAAGLDADVCIVGAGAAGMTLALELRESGLDVLLVEAGGLDLEAASQQLYEASQVGIQTDPLHVNRLRVFGGTTGHWGGWCFPLDEIDFESRPWVPHSGWPFSRNELDAAYAAAHRILQIEEPDYDYRNCMTEEERQRGIGLESEVLRNFVIHIARPMRMGTVYREELKADPRVRVVFHANVLEFEANANASQVQAVRATTLGEKEFRIRAKRYVLATGTVENARLLLSSNSVQPNGLGNDRDLVGRFFMQHAQVVKALWASEQSAEAVLGRDSARDDAVVATALSEAALRENEILNYHFLVLGKASPHRKGILGPVREAVDQLRAIYSSQDLARDVAGFVASVDHEAAAAGDGIVSRIAERAEQAPNPDSRVFLGDERDALGMRRIVMDWRLGELDRFTLQRSRELLAREVGRLGLGRLRDWPEGYDPTVPLGDYVHGGHHHFGTTRMHDDPAQGVVDRNARVHGIANLYVAGGSVFPTTGFANPTLTIVALAARLARELRRGLS